MRRAAFRDDAGTPRIRRLLVIEDHTGLREQLRDRFAPLVAEARGAATVEEARASIEAWRPDVIVLDVHLPDGDARTILDVAMTLRPFPVVVAISGEADPTTTFELAQRGVRAFLPKPVCFDALEQAVRHALAAPPDFVPFVRAAVGHAPLHHLEDSVRREILGEAMARTRGSKSAAARLLALSRQALQHALRAIAEG